MYFNKIPSIFNGKKKINKLYLLILSYESVNSTKVLILKSTTLVVGSSNKALDACTKSISWQLKRK